MSNFSFIQHLSAALPPRGYSRKQQPFWSVHWIAVLKRTYKYVEMWMHIYYTHIYMYLQLQTIRFTFD